MNRMNKKGEALLLAVIMAIFIYLFGVLFIDFIQMEATDATSAVTLSGGPGLNCGTSSNPNQNVSDGTKLTCLVTDGVVPYFIMGLISIVGGMLISKALT